MKQTRAEAIVLRRTDYGEADRIVQFLTPDGKLSALARGVRREKSKLAGGIELLSLADITIHQGKGELYTLTSARVERFFSHILQEYDRLEFAYYVLRDVARAAEQIDDPAFFELTKQTLVALDVLLVPLAAIEMSYRLQMAKILGQDINLTRDIDGKKLQADQNYLFHVGEMGLMTKPNGDITASHIKLLRLASVADPRLLANVEHLDELLASCLVVARAAHE